MAWDSDHSIIFVKQETNYFHSFRIKELLISTKALTM